MVMKALIHAAQELVNLINYDKNSYVPEQVVNFVHALEDELKTLEITMSQQKKYIAIDIALPLPYGNGSIEKGQLLIDTTDTELVTQLLAATVVKRVYSHDYKDQPLVLATNALTLTQVVVDLDSLPTEANYKAEQDKLWAENTPPVPVPPPAPVKVQD